MYERIELPTCQPFFVFVRVCPSWFTYGASLDRMLTNSFLRFFNGSLIVGSTDTCSFFILYLRPIIYVAFDREFARSQGIPVQIFEYVLMMFIALTIVACLRMVGIVLVISLLTIPQMTANLFTHRFHRIIWLSIGIGYLSCLGGLMISYYLNVPSGAAIIFFSIIIYVICKLGKSFYLSLRQKTQNP